MHTGSLTPLTLARLADCSGGRLVGADRAVGAISTDSRTLLPNTVFAALRGDRFDGHEFATAAAERGACALLVERQLPISLPQVVVPDTLGALAACARAQRRRFTGPVVAVTGSNGKTTTKEMLGAIFAQRGPCLVTKGNLNNHIGVPLTLLALRDDHRCAVIEMGANHRGEIAHLVHLAEPNIGVVTNAGAAHLEGFGSLEGVAAGKGELFAGLPDDGVAVINADDCFAPMWRSLAGRRRCLTFGLDRPADFAAVRVASAFGPAGTSGAAAGASLEFELVSPAGTVPVRMALAGLHNLRNALGAAAAAFAAGTPLDDVARGLAAVRAVKGRLELKPAINGAFLVDDSYNANPGSLKAGLDAFQSFAGPRWLVLGDMMELGSASDELHAAVGREARALGIERLWAFGTRARLAAEAFGVGGAAFDDMDALIGEMRHNLRAGVGVLVKGSRANRLERLAAALVETPEDQQ
jgi:UDP-N-acetylmuramoyl-tripeptide--D-alanyl-D-alanine ligase